MDVLGDGAGEGLAGWELVSPRENLRPGFRCEGRSLSISGDGNPYEFGYWRRRIPVQGGRSYRVGVEFRPDGVVDVPLNVLNMVVWRSDGEAGRPRSAHDHLSHLWRAGALVRGEGRFRVPPEATVAEIQLGLRFAPQGSVTWECVDLSPCQEDDRDERRTVRVSAVSWGPEQEATVSSNRRRMAELVEAAAGQGSDLVLLPECALNHGTDLHGYEASEPVPGGPTCELMAQAAREHQINVCLNLYERENGLVFNTAVLIDRNGELAGRYRKVHPYWPEEVWDGVSPGSDLPVFSLDVGSVGVMTCYDSWYPEVSRLLALRGAEIILFPSAGYDPSILPARAIDNRCYVVASSLSSPAIVVDTVGTSLARTSDGVVTVPIDLARRPTPHPNAGGSLNSSPGGRRSMRNALSWSLYEDLLAEARDWDGRQDAGFVWSRPTPAQALAERSVIGR
jgi:predicted amidohydrolase